MYLWYYRGKFGGCRQIPTQKWCRDQNCVAATGAFGQNVTTFGCWGNMPATCRQHVGNFLSQGVLICSTWCQYDILQVSLIKIEHSLPIGCVKH